jgi:AcrR family transcriptional regulator
VERTEATRSRLLRNARTVFEKRGYGGASVADIVNAAGVARGTFYVHFGSKREIFVAVVDAVKQDLLAAQLRPPDGAQTIADAVRQNIEQYLRAYKASARMIVLIEETSIFDRAVRLAWLQTREALLANTIEALEQLRERGLAHFDGSTRTVALCLGAMTERMGAMRYMLGYHFPDDEFYGTLTAAYLNAAGIVGDFQLAPRELPAGDGDTARRRSRRQ